MTGKIQFLTVLGILVLYGPALAADCSEPPQGLISYWAFDEGSGTTAEDCVGGNHGTLLNDPMWTVGLIDGALSFDGINDYISLGSRASLDDLPLNDLTVCAWIYDECTLGATWGTVAGCYARNRGWSIRTFSNADGDRSLTFQAPHSTVWAEYWSSDATISQNTWHHVAAVWDASTKTAKLYIDGDEASYQLTTPGVGTYNSDASKNKEIGRIPHVGGIQYFNGTIDDVHIYGRALSAEEVEQLYREGTGGFGLTIFYISDAIAEKEELLAIIDETLEKEWQAYDALEQLLESGDYGDLKKSDIIKARQKIHSAIQHQEQSMDALEKSIESLEDSLSLLGGY